MKNILIPFLVMAFALALLTVKGTMASGDKVRGDEGQGPVVQNCNSFESECPYGTYDPFEPGE